MLGILQYLNLEKMRNILDIKKNIKIFLCSDKITQKIKVLEI